ncbi:HNH endonuclease signature motif containing protein [Pseudomonas sp. DC1.2]|nr:HNH endonuclease signature motif containing protein [Pseudomonas sp. DC1.2]MEB0098238.1 HNH endonuclease signature motif containing protein [Pseudomonas sp. DC1.2]WPX59196.1 HNH endonuclease signature motif containing protein [Pseudomonas sp. DC1.2]
MGQDVTGIWLAGAGIGLGSPIPTRIADQLRGREFSSFDAFRKAFWVEVGNDSELSRQFNQQNIGRMHDGYAPNARYNDAIGKRKVFELHHIDLVSEGGEVYDVDNLRINTPKNHIDIHRG